MLKEILQGRFMKHPLHPIFVHVPIGLWMASLIFDIVNLIGGHPNFAVASYYCIALGILGVLLAAPTGLAEYIEIPSNTRPKRIAIWHLVLNISITAFYITNFFIRRSLEDGPPRLVTIPTFLMSSISIVLLGISGYLGGLLVYEFGIGFRPESRNEEKPDETQEESRRAA